MIKIAHIADCHLRSQQYGYKVRGADFFEGMKNAVLACLNAGAKHILCSGDLFDTTSPSSRVVVDQLGAISSILHNHKATMYVSAGNHDLTDPHWACSCVTDDPYGVKVPEPREVICIEDGDESLTVVALPWMPPQELRDTLTTTPSADILMWHGEIKEFTGYPKPEAVEIADFPKGKWTVIAMGDQHVHEYIRRDDGLVIAYPGSTESCSKSEEHDKMAYMYTFDHKTLISIEDVPFKTRPKQVLTLHTDEDVDRAGNELISGALVYCEHNNLKNVRNRLMAAADKRGLDPVILTLTTFSTQKAEVLRVDRNAAIVSPGQYIKDHANQYFNEEHRDRLTNLCVALLTPTLDAKDTIARFCKQELEQTT